MININLTEHSIFSYSNDNEEIIIHIHDHEEGRFKGKVQEGIGSIKFKDWQLASDFLEILELAVNKDGGTDA